MRKTLKKQIYSLIREPIAAPDVARQYQLRLKDYRLTRDENPESHFCVYFAAFDPKRKEVFIGHHKKSNLWLFSGGHIDQGELIEDTVSREIWEEWGQRISAADVPRPTLLTITQVSFPYSSSLLESESSTTWSEAMGSKTPSHRFYRSVPSLQNDRNIAAPNITCKTHFDIWYFFPVEKERFKVDQSKISEEFYEIGWKSIEDAYLLITDSSTVSALDLVQLQYV